MQRKSLAKGLRCALALLLVAAVVACGNSSEPATHIRPGPNPPPGLPPNGRPPDGLPPKDLPPNDLPPLRSPAPLRPAGRSLERAA